MKATPFVFLAAVGLLTVAIAVPQRVEPPKQTLALDGEGVTSMRVEGDVEVQIDYTPGCDCGEPPEDPQKTPSVRWPSDGEGRIDVRRDGDTLVLVATGLEGAEIQVLPPAGIRSFDIGRGTLSSTEPLPPTSVRTRGSFGWAADTEALDIVQTPTPECLAEDYCFVFVNVGGRIDDVQIDAGFAQVKLSAPQDFRRAVVRLAPESDLTLEDARRIDNVVVEYVDFDGAPLTAAQAAEVRAALLAEKEDENPEAARARARAALEAM